METFIYGTQTRMIVTRGVRRSVIVGPVLFFCESESLQLFAMHLQNPPNGCFVKLQRNVPC